MKLSEAVLCLDCDSIYSAARTPVPAPVERREPCPYCGGGAGWPLQQWLQPLAVLESIHSSIEQARKDIHLEKQKMEGRYRNGARRTPGSI